VTDTKIDFIVQRNASLLFACRATHQFNPSDAPIEKDKSMNSLKGKFLCIALGVSAFATLGAAPTFAASRQSNVFANDVVTDSVPISAKRAAAVHDCSVTAGKLNFSTWQSAQLAVYGECMTNHGEMP
jgi:hypothetical protein